MAIYNYLNFSQSIGLYSVSITLVLFIKNPAKYEERTNLFASNAPNSNTEQDAGMNMVDILTLSTRQQQIINWIMRQQQSTLEVIAVYIEAELEEASAEIADLIRQGFIEARQ